MGGPQLHAGINPPVFAPEPLAVGQVSTGELHPDAGLAEAALITFPASATGASYLIDGALIKATQGLGSRPSTRRQAARARATVVMLRGNVPVDRYFLAPGAIIVAPCEALRLRPGAGPNPAPGAGRLGCR